MGETSDNAAKGASSAEAAPQITSQKLTTEQAEKLSQLIKLLPDILSKTKNPVYDEIFGYRINVSTEEHVLVPVRDEILLKFLIANEYNVETTKDKLIGTLNWRNKFRPLSAAFDETYVEELDSLGLITVFEKENKPNLKVVTWNLYGNLKSPKKLFEAYGTGQANSKLPGTAFLRWRIGLMERSLGAVDFTKPENHKVAQVHDYKGVSMFRIDPNLKAATKDIVQIFGDNYPELLSVKFFLNVPLVMSWVFYFFKKIGIISEETMKKFEVLNSGNLAEWFGTESLPKEYNGGVSSPYKDLQDIGKKTKGVQISLYGKILSDILRVQDAAREHERGKEDVAEATVGTTTGVRSETGIDDGEVSKKDEVTEEEAFKEEIAKKEDISKKEAVVDNSGPAELEGSVPDEKFAV